MRRDTVDEDFVPLPDLHPADGCLAESGVASAMGTAFIAQARDFEPQVVANAAETSLQHHLA